MYMLISVVERDIQTEMFKNLGLAREEMRRQFTNACKGLVDDYIEDCMAELHDKYNDIEHFAWVTDGANHDDYDWKIIKI